MSLYIKRNAGETWLDAALRYANPYGLESEVANAYARAIDDGATPKDAAFAACYEWDLCDFRDETQLARF